MSDPNTSSAAVTGKQSREELPNGKNVLAVIHAGVLYTVSFKRKLTLAQKFQVQKAE